MKVYRMAKTDDDVYQVISRVTAEHRRDLMEEVGFVVIWVSDSENSDALIDRGLPVSGKIRVMSAADHAYHEAMIEIRLCTHHWDGADDAAKFGLLHSLIARLGELKIKKDGELSISVVAPDYRYEGMWDVYQAHRESSPEGRGMAEMMRAKQIIDVQLAMNFDAEIERFEKEGEL